MIFIKEIDMIFIYDKKLKKISTYRGSGENYLLGEELFIITTDYNRFDKTSERLDLLAIDKEGNLVIIELLCDDSGKCVELQAIKHAAYCSTLTLSDVAQIYCNFLSKSETINEEEAKKRIVDFIDNDEFEELSDKPRIILVAKEFRPEVTASVLWLRKFGINITCIKLTPYEFSENIGVFKSTILIPPLSEAKDFIIESEKKENIEYTTLTQQEYLEFYKELINRLKQIHPRQYPNPTPRSYYQIPIGISGVHFEWGFHGRPRDSFGVELHFETRDKAHNKNAIKSLEKFKQQIEKETNEVVTFQEEWGKSKSWARLYLQRKGGEITEELKDWAVKNMKKLIDILQPELEKMR